MGFQTDMMFLNDDTERLFEVIRKKPDHLINEIRTLMNGRPQYGLADSGGKRKYLGSLEQDRVTGTYLTVQRSHHADDAMLYLSYRNTLRPLDQYSIENLFAERLSEKFMLDLLDQEVKLAEQRLKGLKAFLKIKRQEMK